MRFGIISLAAAAAVCTGGQAHAETSFSIAPRFWYLTDNIGFGGLQTVPVAGSPGLTEQFVEYAQPFHIPMYGASVTIVPNESSRTILTLTALTGSDTASGNTIGGFAVPSQVTFSRQSFESKNRRLDLEGSAQFRVNDNFGWLVGLRYERAKIDVVTNIVGSNAIVGAPPAPFNVTVPFEDKYSIVSGRLGATGSIPITADGRHRVTATAMAFLGRRSAKNDTSRVDDAWLAGPDVSVGYAVDLTEQFTLDARYRAIYFYALSGRDDGGDPKTTHGINVSLAYRF